MKELTTEERYPTKKGDRSKFVASDNDGSESDDDASAADAATEWISLVLERLASRGLLERMYRSAGSSIGSSSSSSSSSSSPFSAAAFPEQVVLFSCLRHAVDGYYSAITPTRREETGSYRRISMDVRSSGVEVSSKPHPLWGRADGSHHDSSAAAVPVLLFLANEAECLRDRRGGNQVEEAYHGEFSCAATILDDARDILAHTLRGDGVISEARLVLGIETSCIVYCCVGLGAIVDEAIAKNAGNKAREMKLSTDTQRNAVCLVRLIGNAAYRCRNNQDLLRTTVVPLPKSSAGGVSNYSNSGGAKASKGSAVEVPRRTGMHVLLSTTSLGVACFTLREWCIIAIRNVVEDNPANAEVVQELEAEKTVSDTPELRKAGVEVELDGKGKVQVKRRPDNE